MKKYNIGDRFKWKEGQCVTNEFKNDIYELDYDKERECYFVKTIYSDNEDYGYFVGDDYYPRLTYDEICEIIDEDLIKIN